MSIDANIKTVPTSDLLSFYKSVELLAQIDPIGSARLFRSPRVLFSFSQMARNLTPTAILYSAPIPANVFIDDGDAVDFCFQLAVVDADEAASYSFEIGGFEFFNTGAIALAANIIVQGQIRKSRNEQLAVTGSLISDAIATQIISAGTGGFDFSSPLPFTLTASSTDDTEANALGGKLIFSPA